MTPYESSAMPASETIARVQSTTGRVNPSVVENDHCPVTGYQGELTTLAQYVSVERWPRRDANVGDRPAVAV